MSEMVERVADAIAKQFMENPPVDDEGSFALARAAIAAMSNPTPEMIERLGKVLYNHYGDPEDRYYAAEWEDVVQEFIKWWVYEALK